MGILLIKALGTENSLNADDTKIYRELVDHILDSQLLKADLTNRSEWACKWQLRRNTDKCESMQITYSLDKSLTNYTLYLVNHSKT